MKPNNFKLLKMVLLLAGIILSCSEKKPEEPCICEEEPVYSKPCICEGDMDDDGQNYFMYYGGEKMFFEVSATKMVVMSESFDTTVIKKILACKLRIIMILHPRQFLIEIESESKAELLCLQKQWNKKEGIIYTSPVFIDEVGKEIAALTNEVIIKLKNAADYSLLTKNAAAYQIEHIIPRALNELSYLLILEHGSLKNAMQTANELYETGLYDYVEPDLIHFNIF